jgi:hypothetical protein
MLAPDARVARAAGGGLAMKGIDAAASSERLKRAGIIARLSDHKLNDPVREMR